VVTSTRAETVLTGLAAATLAGMTGRAVGLGRAGLVVGAISGVITGRRRVYDWTTRRGVVAFAADHTWALATTTSGLVAMGVNLVRGNPGYEPSLSTRQNRMTYRRGLVLRRGFAVTFGNVVNGAGDESGELSERRRKLVTIHEDAHVWQARAFGPMYPLVYGAWFAGGALVGAVKWLVSDRSVPLSQKVDAYAYYRNPFEWHAYSRDDNWPPRGIGIDTPSIPSARFPVRKR
jgi:hypothetical protein